MLVWYEDEEIGIYFDKMPNLTERYITPFASEEEIKDIKTKPFICLDNLEVKLIDFNYCEEYEFEIPKGYTWDGASIPRMFWWLIGAKTDPQYLIASCLHDYMLENKEVIDYDRKLTSKVFKGCLRTAGVSSFKAQIMYLAVDNFQKFCDWSK